MSFPLVRTLAMVTLGLLPAAAHARPIVLELFTSQGCSACPPAEVLLGELANQPDLLPLGFHVTYWDHLGWKDTFSLPAATDRQAAYASRFGEGSFTPQLVVDGTRSLVGSRRGEAREAIAAAQVEAAAVDLSLTRRAGALSIAVGSGHGPARVVLIGFDHSRSTAIARGENRARTVAQTNVVRSIQDLGRWDGKDLTLGAAMPAGEDAAVILQRGDGHVIGAARLGSGA